MSEARSSILRRMITGSDTVDDGDARGELADIGSSITVSSTGCAKRDTFLAAAGSKNDPSTRDPSSCQM